MKRILLSFAFLAIAACGSNTPAPAPGPGDGTAVGGGDGTGTGTGVTAGACKRGGCSSQLCVEEGDDAISTCEYRAEYACYAKAECARQADGTCGWTANAELTACLAQPPAM